MGNVCQEKRKIISVNIDTTTNEGGSMGPGRMRKAVKLCVSWCIASSKRKRKKGKSEK